MNIFIGCSAGNNIEEIYKEISRSLVSRISKLDINLVYGGYNQGIMNICYEEFKNNGRKITGVTPTVYEDDLNIIDCDEKIFTNTTMERFNEIYKLSDIFLFLPGGVGTLAELFNAIEENRTNDNNKKLIIIYNREYFYTGLVKELYKMYENKFIDDKLTDYIVIESLEDEVVKLIEERINE